MTVDGPDAARPLDLTIEGGAMGRMRKARLDGAERSFRDLVDQDKFWAQNGAVGPCDRPLAGIDKGQTVRIRMLNDTAFPKRCIFAATTPERSGPMTVSARGAIRC